VYLFEDVKEDSLVLGTVIELSYVVLCRPHCRLAFFCLI
jgi:hypothetical protein